MKVSCTLICSACAHPSTGYALVNLPTACEHCGGTTWKLDFVVAQSAGEPYEIQVPVTKVRVHGHVQIDLVQAVGSPYLGGRYRYQGPYSGEEFLHSSLIPALDAYDIVEVFLDGIMGPTPSFFEEAFGGAARHYGIEVRHRIRLVASRNAHLIPQITSYMDEAAGVATR